MPQLLFDNLWFFSKLSLRDSLIPLYSSSTPIAIWMLLLHRFYISCFIIRVWVDRLSLRVSDTLTVWISSHGQLVPSSSVLKPFLGYCSTFISYFENTLSVFPFCLSLPVYPFLMFSYIVTVGTASFYIYPLLCFPVSSAIRRQWLRVFFDITIFSDFLLFLLVHLVSHARLLVGGMTTFYCTCWYQCIGVLMFIYLGTMVFLLIAFGFLVWLFRAHR